MVGFLSSRQGALPPQEDKMEQFGQYGTNQAPVEHSDVYKIAERTIIFVIWTYIIEWFAKRAWHHPGSFIMFVLCATAVVLISVSVQHFFWPVWIPLVLGFIFLGRMLRRNV